MTPDEDYNKPTETSSEDTTFIKSMPSQENNNTAAESKQPSFSSLLLDQEGIKNNSTGTDHVDSKGRCLHHPHVKLRKKKLLGRVRGSADNRWKVLMEACPDCCVEELRRIRYYQLLQQQSACRPAVASSRRGSGTDDGDYDGVARGVIGSTSDSWLDEVIHPKEEEVDSLEGDLVTAAQDDFFGSSCPSSCSSSGESFKKSPSKSSPSSQHGEICSKMKQPSPIQRFIINTESPTTIRSSNGKSQRRSSDDTNITAFLTRGSSCCSSTGSI